MPRVSEMDVKSTGRDRDRERDWDGEQERELQELRELPSRSSVDSASFFLEAKRRNSFDSVFYVDRTAEFTKEAQRFFRTNTASGRGRSGKDDSDGQSDDFGLRSHSKPR